MATPNLVPRADNEGGLGTALKRWAAGFTAALTTYVLTITSFVSAGYVKNAADGSLSGGNSIAAGDFPAAIDAAKIGAGAVSNTEFGYLDGATSGLQGQLDLKAPKASPTFSGTVTLPVAAAGFVKNDAAGVLSEGNAIAAGDLPAAIDAVKIGAGGVSNTVFGYLAGVTSAIQTQLNTKLAGAKIGYFTKNTADNSGTTSVVTGLGFAPRQVILFAVVTATTELSVGMDDGTLHQCLQNAFPFTAGTWRDNVLFSISLNQTTTDNYSGCVTTLGTDGFTVTWTKTGSPTGTATILWHAVG
jgi:hypothetical protein